MNSTSVKKWAVFFIGILCAIVIADALSNAIVTLAGVTGATGFIVSFVLYACLFFAILYGIEKLFHIEFFSFRQE
jgi:UDP-N-acetylmuramyl pentapeptide phosphotransferase/UDP-N-acetylglucosamine-1-phosphate transferase